MAGSRQPCFRVLRRKTTTCDWKSQACTYYFIKIKDTPIFKDQIINLKLLIIYSTEYKDRGCDLLYLGSASLNLSEMSFLSDQWRQSKSFTQWTVWRGYEITYKKCLSCCPAYTEYPEGQECLFVFIGMCFLSSNSMLGMFLGG